jgi:hypothetical protein
VLILIELPLPKSIVMLVNNIFLSKKVTYRRQKSLTKLLMILLYRYQKQHNIPPNANNTVRRKKEGSISAHPLTANL